MSQSQSIVNKLHQHVKKNGTSGLLPQHLTDELLHRIYLEGEALEEDRTEETPSSVLLLSILYLKNGKKILKGKEVEVTIPTEDLMEYFSMYVTAARMEAMRREKYIEIPNEDLPTLDNLFDKTREITIKRV